MEFVVTFDVADPLHKSFFTTYSMSKWKENIKDLRGQMEERGHDLSDMSDEDVIEWLYNGTCFFKKVSLNKIHGYWHLEEE